MLWCRSMLQSSVKFHLIFVNYTFLTPGCFHTIFFNRRVWIIKRNMCCLDTTTLECMNTTWVIRRIYSYDKSLHFWHHKNKIFRAISFQNCVSCQMFLWMHDDQLSKTCVFIITFDHRLLHKAHKVDVYGVFRKHISNLATEKLKYCI